MLRINYFLRDWLLSSDTLTKNSMHSVMLNQSNDVKEAIASMVAVL
ncbi:hypothetical protein Niako_1027 [Niastella koreensis GR20-10]|uniref:Uncharacterized protein n=1 Tax=Niastella koreensis (strain DSM 17620 / KACC 11465 / NBRC 106392 / GR20-10) TaxID=700598 RepID=G8TGI3_NIAKG|nr:hypothetical protein Niako_1027 [Niastella koreensis GR20-10]